MLRISTPLSNDRWLDITEPQRTVGRQYEPVLGTSRCGSCRQTRITRKRACTDVDITHDESMEELVVPDFQALSLQLTAAFPPDAGADDEGAIRAALEAQAEVLSAVATLRDEMTRLRSWMVSEERDDQDHEQ